MSRFRGSHPRRGPRRGAALLLVLVALAIGLLLVSTWLEGRRESVPVARRLASNALARHAAAGAAELAITTLDAHADWRESVAAGRYAEEIELDGATCRFEITDADDGAAPDADTVRVQVIAAARVDEVEACVCRIFEVTAENPPIDVSYGETAIVVSRDVQVRDRAAVLPWVATPGAFGGSLVLGSLDGRPEAVRVESSALVADAEIIEVDPRIGEISTPGRRVLADPLPDRDPARPTSPSGHPASRRPVDLDVAPETDILAATVRIPGRSRLVIEGDRVIRSLTDLVVEDAAEIVVRRGTLVLDAGHDLLVRRAAIQVDDGATLVIHGERRVEIDHAHLAPSSVAPAASRTEIPPLERHAGRIWIRTGRERSTVILAGASGVVADVVAPKASVHVEEDAVLHGRIRAERVEIRDDALVYARPDDGRVVGLTSPVGPHRGDDGRLLPAIADADPTRPGSMSEAAESTGLCVCGEDVVAAPDPGTTAARWEEIRERLRRLIEDRRRRRGGPRWAWGGGGDDA